MTDFRELSDAELWQGIADSADAMAHLALQSARIVGGRTSVSDRARQAELMVDQYRRWNAVRAEYELSVAELERRRPKQNQS